MIGKTHVPKPVPQHRPGPRRHGRMHVAQAKSIARIVQRPAALKLDFAFQRPIASRARRPYNRPHCRRAGRQRPPPKARKLPIKRSGRLAQARPVLHQLSEAVWRAITPRDATEGANLLRAQRVNLSGTEDRGGAATLERTVPVAFSFFLTASVSFEPSAAKPLRFFKCGVIVLWRRACLGVTSAYFLQQLGHEVTVIDRQAHNRPAETSFANGGQISVSPRRAMGQPERTAEGCCSGSARKTLPCLFRLRAPTCGSGSGDCSSCANARRARHPPTTSSRSFAWATYSRENAAANCGRDTGNRLRPANPGHPPLLYDARRNSTPALAPAETRCGALGCDRRGHFGPTRPWSSSPRWPTSARNWPVPPIRAEDESGDANRFRTPNSPRWPRPQAVRFLMSHTVTRAWRESRGHDRPRGGDRWRRPGSSAFGAILFVLAMGFP